MEELKRNREARDAAREDLEMIKRDEERRHNSDWYATEEGFLLSQAKLRTQIRLKEGRAKPIDFLARYLILIFLNVSLLSLNLCFSLTALVFFAYSQDASFYNSMLDNCCHFDVFRYITYDSEKVKSKQDEEFELVDPITYLRGLKIRDLEDLLEDIKVV